MLDLAAARTMMATTHSILALTWFCQLSMCLWSLWGGLRSPKGGPPYTWKKLQCLKMIFKTIWSKKIKKVDMENDPCWPTPSPPSMEFSIFFKKNFEPFPYHIFLTLPQKGVTIIMGWLWLIDLTGSKINPINSWSNWSLFCEVGGSLHMFKCSIIQILWMLRYTLEVSTDVSW